MKVAILCDTPEAGYDFATAHDLQPWQYRLVTKHWHLYGMGSGVLIKVPGTTPYERMQKYLNDHTRIYVAEASWGGVAHLIKLARQQAAPGAPPEDAPSDPQGR